MEYWKAGDFAIAGPLFLAVLKDEHTTNIFEKGYNEGYAIQLYRDQILMGKKLVEMIRNSKTTFDQQTKLELSGILFSIGDADIVSVLINGGSPIGFEIKYAASSVFTKHFSNEKDYLTIEYPPNTYDWGSLYFSVVALDGRVNEMDFSPYTKLVIEMRSETGDEVFEIAMKDVNDPPDGSESRVKIELSTDWKLYEIETKQFVTANMNRIMVPLAFVFEGSEGKKIHVRSIQFKKD
ncbi:unnamed protein product [Ectocarpus sp. 12 AP-2014]